MTLNLSKNKIGTVEKVDLQGLSQIASLNLTSNSINKITAEAFSWSENLHEIGLADNRLENLHNNTFNGKVRSTLMVLDMSNNLFR